MGTSSVNASLTYAPQQTDAGDHFLVISGEIETTDDLSQFISAVQVSGAKGIVFNSPGGSVVKAWRGDQDVNHVMLYLLTCHT
jgi:hypothetical protein